MADPFRPRWRCKAPGCPLKDQWQPVPAARDRTDLAAAKADYDAHQDAAHPDVEEVSSDGARVLAA